MIPLKKYKMVYLYLHLIAFAFIGCTGSGNELTKKQPAHTVKVDTLSLDTLKNRVMLTQPDTHHMDAKVYGDTIRAIVYNKTEGILITGNFSNGCTHLKNVNYSQSGDTLNVSLEGWQPRDKICTQALEPFQYIDASRTSKWLSQFSVYRFPTR